MPWIDERKCIGCGIYINEFLVSAISIKNEKAIIDMEKCKRCYEICPQNVVRHDSEKNQKGIK
jgi:TPP-dependent indolepyruvate ferredoxin oxidoreductase alpha subunit